MAGCELEAWPTLEAFLQDVSCPGGCQRVGGPGAGHFVKLVHNGIEFGMMQAIGEGLALLERSETRPDIAASLEVWRHGSVVRSWLVDLISQAYTDRGGMGDVPSHIEDTGEVNWLVQDAVRMEVPAPVITQSVIQLFASRDRTQEWARAIALMRLGFGGHGLGPIPALAEERKTMRVGGVWEP
jgi:6-phosphogluconate dehydrogenase